MLDGSQGGSDDEEVEVEGKCQQMITTLTSACEGLLATGSEQRSATWRYPDNEIWVMNRSYIMVIFHCLTTEGF